MMGHKQQEWVKWGSGLLMVILVMIVGVYFRIYPIHNPIAVGTETNQEAARYVVGRMMQRFHQILVQQYPEMNERERLALAERQARQAAKEDPDQFANAVKGAAKQWDRAKLAQESRTYLLGADSYYFFGMTRLFLDKGSKALEVYGGRYWNPLRNSPRGSRSAFYWHPYVGIGVYRVAQLIHPEIDLMGAVAYVPLVLYVVSVGVFFFVCTGLGIQPFSMMLGGILFALTPVFIQRSALGWYDTDPYNCIFPPLILGCFFWATRQDRQNGVLWSFVGAVVTSVYALFWAGWPLFFSLTCGLAALAAIIFHFKGGTSGNTFFKFLLFYVPVTLVDVTLLLGPVRLMEVFTEGFSFLNKFNVSEVDLWPNVFLTVGETRSIGLRKFIFLTGNYVVFSLSVVGLLYGLTAHITSKNVVRFCHWLVLVMTVVIVSALAFRTERFTLLVVPPLLVLCAHGIDFLIRVFDWTWARFLYMKNQFYRVGRIAFFAVMMFGCLPMSVIVANVVVSGLEPVMNDTWYSAMKGIKDKTPADAIVNAWWSPGHFVTSIAERRVTVDGANQFQPQSYWLARAFMANTELEAAGILRMLNVSGNEAVDLLEEWGLSVGEAVSILNHIVTKSRSRASISLPSTWSDEQKTALLDLTHRTNPLPPTYVMVYDDVVVQNAAMSVVAQWDFAKAAQTRGEDQAARSVSVRGSFDATDHYLKKLKLISGDILKYTPEAELKSKQGDMLTFSNGLFVKLSAMDSIIKIPGQDSVGRPMSLFHVAGDEFAEIKYGAGNLPIAALLIEKEGAYSSVLADPRLVQSMLFRLFYLDGKGFKLFRRIVAEEGELNETRVYAYELDWQAFHQQLEQEENHES